MLVEHWFSMLNVFIPNSLQFILHSAIQLLGADIKPTDINTFIYDITNDVVSQRIFNMNNTAKNINYLSSPNPISGIYILQEWNQCWATIYVHYVHRLHDGPLFLHHSTTTTTTTTTTITTTLSTKLRILSASCGRNTCQTTPTGLSPDLITIFSQPAASSAVATNNTPHHTQTGYTANWS